MMQSSSGSDLGSDGFGVLVVVLFVVVVAWALFSTKGGGGGLDWNVVVVFV
jgi:hypothetical protein